MNAVKKRSEKANTIPFGEWGLDDKNWEEEAEPGKLQDALPERLTSEACQEVVDTILTGEGVEDEALSDGVTTEDLLVLVDAANGFNTLSSVVD